MATKAENETMKQEVKLDAPGGGGYCTCLGQTVGNHLRKLLLSALREEMNLFGVAREYP